MASISVYNPPNIRFSQMKPFSIDLIVHPFPLSFTWYKARSCAIKIGPDGGAVRNSQKPTSLGSDLLRKPESENGYEEESEKKAEDGDTWVDWEDQILEDTVPLVGFVRMILHSRRYESGDRLGPEHERTLLERLLRYHPESEKKIGCGVDYITIGYIRILKAQDACS